MKKKRPPMRKRPDYKIGYGRPPEASQFKKGTSGNKKGRPKGRKNIATIFHQEMFRPVVISENGQRRTITKIEAAIKQLINKAATGDPKAFQAVLNFARELGDLKLPDPVQKPLVFTLNVFDKDLKTGELVRVHPGTTTRYDETQT